MEKGTGCLHIIATPIGNLDDISFRAIKVLKASDLIVAEDTRHSRKLLDHFDIDRPMLSYHEHSHGHVEEKLIERLLKGQNLSLISDAGTPLIADPGYRLVKRAHEMNIQVQPLPGPCALITALCASGLPSDRFIFTGFLTAKPQARKKEIEQMADSDQTWIFYETPHRILDTLKTLSQVLETSRKVVIARELTKRFETILSGTSDDLYTHLSANTVHCKGEFVVMVEGKEKNTGALILPETKKMLELLMQELPLNKASALTAKLTGTKKRDLYTYGLTLSHET